jgi:hypothetical protein
LRGDLTGDVMRSRPTCVCVRACGGSRWCMRGWAVTCHGLPRELCRAGHVSHAPHSRCAPSLPCAWQATPPLQHRHTDTHGHTRTHARAHAPWWSARRWCTCRGSPRAAAARRTRSQTRARRPPCS